MAAMKTLHASEVVEDFHQASKRLAFMATCEGKFPRVRPMSPLAIENGVIWVAARSESSKMGQIAQDPYVELCYMKEDLSHVRIRGSAEIVEDPATKRRLWDRNQEVQRYFRSADSPEFSVIKITMSEVLLMPAASMDYQHLEP